MTVLTRRVRCSPGHWWPFTSHHLDRIYCGARTFQAPAMAPRWAWISVLSLAGDAVACLILVIALVVLTPVLGDFISQRSSR